MTVDELCDRLKMISTAGFGDSVVKIFDGDSEQIEEVSCMTYGSPDGIVELFSDVP